MAADLLTSLLPATKGDEAAVAGPQVGEGRGGRHRVEPLILASAAYPQMEAVALKARHTLRLAFRIFEPGTRLRSDAALELGLSNWTELLAHRAAAGVKVELLIADFDPLFAGDLHRTTRDSVAALAAAADASGGRLAVLAARHPGELGAFWRMLLWPAVRRQARHSSITRLWPPVHLWPGTHHMKLIVADGSDMVIGGLDVSERRYDDPSHARPAEQTWHDVSLRVEGPAARDADAFVRWLWRRELARRSRLKGNREEQAIPALGAALEGRPGRRTRKRARAARAVLRRSYRPATGAPDDVRFHVTASVRQHSPFARGPSLRSASIMETAIAAIGEASRYLYIENQFVRDEAVGTAIANRMRAASELQTILLVPAAPDEVLFQSDRSNGQRFGEWRQLKILTSLAEEFGDRLGIFTLSGARLPEAQDVEASRAIRDGRGIVYVHSKVLIADDRLALVSSANFNGRSLRMDTEAGVSWHAPDGVTAFRQSLWAHHLRRRTAGEGDLLAVWRQAAQDNRAGVPGRAGSGPFVVPWDAEATRAFARRAFHIPSRYV